MADNSGHITTGIRKILEFPLIYEFWQRLVGSRTALTRYVRDFIQPEQDSVLLDIGCGPGNILKHLPSSIQYTGFDLNLKYIEKARRIYASRGKFYCGRVSEFNGQENILFNIVMANAVLHHISDDEADDLFASAYKVLKPGGFLITHDGVYLPGQHRLARWLLSKDRGKNIRTKEAYLALAEKHFDTIEHYILHDFYRMPYTILIMKCYK